VDKTTNRHERMTDEVTVALSALSTSVTACPSPAGSGNDIDVEKQFGETSVGELDHVDVRYAEEQFEELKRRYSNLSRVASAQSHPSRGKLGQSVPDEGEESEDEFDLEDMLRDRHLKEVEHDIKPKHLGIPCGTSPLSQG
jgi:predicted small secreted protein